MSMAALSTDGITVFAPAKLNLYLHVLGRRDNGYHDLESLVAFADVGDHIAAAPASNLTLSIDGAFAEDLIDDDENLVLRAARALQATAGVDAGAALTLTKNLPVASGIGGGSADAAATIKALVRLWGIHPATHDLSGLALSLGADVPVCLFGRPAFMTGIGETLEPAPDLPAASLVLINPGLGLSTPDVFKARRGDAGIANSFDEPIADAQTLADVLAARNNDLTAAAISLAPEIGQVLSVLGGAEGCLLARMSGSGATCFGLFADTAAATAAAAAMRGAHPAWWVVASRLGI